MKRLLMLCCSAVLALMMTACATPTAVQPEDTGATATTTQSTSPATQPAAADPTAQENAAAKGAAPETPTTTDSTAGTAAQTAPSIPATQPPAPTTKSTTRSTSTTPRPSATARPSTTRPSSTARPTAPATSAPSAPQGDRMEQVAALVNQERAKAGLAPLTLNAELSANAQVRAREIVSKFDHTRPDGSQFSTAVTIAWRTVGENIAYGQTSPEAVMQAWMNSSGHRQNILGTGFDKIGVGVVESGGRLYWVQLFAG